MLELRNVSKHFGGLKAVQDVSFSINKKEIVGLIGPNGAGKTTMFNLITGFEKVTEGSIYFEGKDVTNLSPPHKRCRLGIARTFQVVKPFLHLTLYENVMVGGFCKTQGVEACRCAVDDVIDLVGAKHLKDKIGSNLTIAERRRMELARALASGPKILLLDEVMAGLTPTEVREFLDILKTIRNDLGITLLIIEHVMAAVMNISERVLVLHHGELICEGEPKEVASNKQVIDAYLGEELYLAET